MHQYIDSKNRIWQYIQTWNHTCKNVIDSFIIAYYVLLQKPDIKRAFDFNLEWNVLVQIAHPKQKALLSQ